MATCGVKTVRLFPIMDSEGDMAGVLWGRSLGKLGYPAWCRHILKGWDREAMFEWPMGNVCTRRVYGVNSVSEMLCMKTTGKMIQHESI